MQRSRTAVTRETVLRLAEVSGIAIGREQRAGVIRNLEIMLGHAEVLARAEIPDPDQPEYAAADRA